jgi:hypothetical protein
MSFLVPSATERPTTQNADFVPGHKIGQFLESGILEYPAGVGGGLGEDVKRKVAVLGCGAGVHGDSLYG